MWVGFGRPAIRATLSIILGSTSAHAHVRLAYADIIAFEPGNPRHVVAESGSYGFFETRDGGATFSYTCRSAYGDASPDDFLDSFALLPGGGIVVAAGFYGLQVGGPGLCSFTKQSAIPGEWVSDVVTSSSGDAVYVASSTVTDASSSAFISRSVDGLKSWQLLGALPPRILPEHIAVAGSDQRRIYVIGFRLGATLAEGAPALFRSRDSGATWEELQAPRIDPNDARFRSMIVSPVDPDAVLLVATLMGETPAPALWVSFDGGATLREVPEGVQDGYGFTLSLPLPGVAFSPDGMEAVFAGAEGLWHIDVPAFRRGEPSVEKYFTGGIWGLTWTPDGLYAGESLYGSEPGKWFMIGVSQDSGRHFARMFDVCDTVIGCGGTGGPAECAMLVDQLRENYLDAERCTNPNVEPFPAVDGGVRDGGSAHRQKDVGARGLSRGPGCACAVGRNERATSGLVAFFAASFALIARNRSKRPRARYSSCRSARSRESSPSRRC